MSNARPTDPPLTAVAEATSAPKPGTVQECHAVIETLAAELALLKHTVALLSEKLSLNSRNSSKPPSSDGPGGGNRAQRRASARKRGAQKGHPGAWREMVPASDVDQIQDCLPPPVCECGGAVAARGQPVRHQVFDLPPMIKPVVSEYRLYGGVCAGCGKSHAALLPGGVSRGQLGARALALVGALGTRFQMPQMKIRDLLAQLLGLDFSVGTISAAHGKVAQALAAPVQQAMHSLAQAPVVHMDETHYGREGTSGNWLWAAIQPQLALYSMLPSRARYVVHNFIGEHPAAVVVSDRYAAYAYIDPEQRQICWAHLLRDFNRIAQRPAEPGRIGARLLGLGYLLFRWRERGQVDALRIERLQRRVHRALQRGAEQAQCCRTARTCANILKLWPALWTFVRNPQVAPTNNAAEQALRTLVIKRKISGPTRSRRGDAFLARGFSAAETCRRQGRDLLGYLHQAVVAWIDGVQPPSLMPQPAPTG